MSRVVLRHQGASSKNQQIQSFPIDEAKSLLIGRDPDAAVQYDANRDDLVGKQHARIMQDPTDPSRYSIVDLNSRNGTFVNRQRVAGTVVLRHGDVIQLGAGGPEIRFELDPPPSESMKETRLAGADALPLPPTREMPSTLGGHAGIGAATLERRITEVKHEGRRTLMLTVAALLVLAIGAGTYVYLRPGNSVTPPTTAEEKWSPERMAAELSGSTVFIEAAWRLVTSSGEQVYHQHVLRGKELFPVFFLLKEERLVPFLTLTSDEGTYRNRPIACDNFTGSGFAVTTDGFIMTNRHVAANWEAPYQCWGNAPRAIVVASPRDIGTNRERVVNMEALAELRWVPAEDGRQISGKSYGGEKVYLDVLFKLNKLRFPAEVARISDRHDVALIKINSPQTVKSLNLLTDDSGIRVGQPVVVMGYPALSPTSTVDVKSNDPFARRTRETIVPDTTVTPGSIGRILSEQARAADDPTTKILSGFGDTYQLTVTATGAGNSGGPVFDEQGRVIGLFTSSNTDRQGTRVTFAVPIRYGIELMGTKPTNSAATR